MPLRIPHGAGPRSALISLAGACAAGLLLASCGFSRGAAPTREPAMAATQGTVRIVFLHHSTGEEIWKGGVPAFIASWNAAHGTRYEITEMAYPSGAGNHPGLRKALPARVFNALFKGGYPWENNPYDYWNLWVRHQGGDRDRGELNLDDLARAYDVIIFKHCFPVSAIQEDGGPADPASRKKTLANYQAQYDALKARMRQFPRTKFIVWTGAALTRDATTPEEAARAVRFSEWVKGVWDEKGDNIFVWDFRELETEGGPYMKQAFATGPRDSHPLRAFAVTAAPLLGRRIVDVVEGRGDQASLTGR